MEDKLGSMSLDNSNKVAWPGKVLNMFNICRCEVVVVSENFVWCTYFVAFAMIFSCFSVKQMVCVFGRYFYINFRSNSVVSIL